MEYKYIKAPKYSATIAQFPAQKCLFLAGSITAAKDWQKEIINIPVEVWGTPAKNPTREPVTLKDMFHIFNPRRDDFDVNDPKMEEEQITWEYTTIHKCANILFWFSNETLAPITLFELGSALHTHNHGHIFIGVDKEYKRKNDVIHQVGLRNKELANSIVYSLEDLAKMVVDKCYY